MGCKPCKSKDTSSTNAFRQSDHPLPHKQPKPDICTICACEISSDVEHLPCAHRFHTACIEEWRRRGHNDCPICRHPMRTTADREVSLDEIDEDSMIIVEPLEAAKPKCRHCAGSGTLQSGNAVHLCSWCGGSGEERDESDVHSSGNGRDDDSGSGAVAIRVQAPPTKGGGSSRAGTRVGGTTSVTCTEVDTVAVGASKHGGGCKQCGGSGMHKRGRIHSLCSHCGGSGR